ncbi:MAG TPA: 2OG-Fe(II) oxygenase [Rudaea sp.]|nr:2OG-Fe(II) oxygenase [Rudaea sp.]
MPYVFDLDTLAQRARDLSAGFGAAGPYPHVVIDDFLVEDAARELARVFPGPDDPVAWDHYAAPGLEVKLGCGREERLPAAIRHALHDLNSGPFIRFLEELTGIDHLLPDPHLSGGGIHLSRHGGHLGIHADFNWHEKLQAHRRLNLLIYLTPDWRREYGGELELWSCDGTRRERVVEPLFNRAVLFTTRSDTFHGHPNPWAAPENIYRQSIALYYYTTNRPDDEVRPAHSTLYKGYNV